VAGGERPRREVLADPLPSRQQAPPPIGSHELRHAIAAGLDRSEEQAPRGRVAAPQVAGEAGALREANGSATIFTAPRASRC